MLTITPNQMSALTQALDERVQARYPQRLRDIFPEQLAAIPEAQLRRWTARDVRDARRLGFSDEQHEWRFLCLRYRLWPLRLSEYHASLAALALHNQDWTPAHRLNFVEHHLVGRKASDRTNGNAT